MANWIRARLPRTAGEPTRSGLAGPSVVHVEPIELGGTWPTAGDLLMTLKTSERSQYFLEEIEGIVTLFALPPFGAPKEFIRSFTKPTLATIENMALQLYPAGKCNLGVCWVVETPYLFAVAWNHVGAQALPIVGLGPARWRPLDAHLTLIHEACEQPPLLASQR